MIFMKESSKNEEQSFEAEIDTDFQASLSIYFNENSDDLMFSCDWQDDDFSMNLIAEILYSLKYSGLVDKICNHIYQQCVENDRLEDFQKIDAYIKNAKKSYSEAEPSNKKEDNEVVIRPTNIK
jgi:hypothetical protein